MLIKNLKFSKDNPRTIKDKSLDNLIKSILKYTMIIPRWNIKKGFRLPKPIIINDIDNEILAGNQRIKALKKMKQDWIHDDDIRNVHIKDEKLKKAFILKMNTHDGSWIENELNNILIDLSSMDDWDILSGFTEDDIFIPESDFDKKSIKKINIEPYKKVHFLISVNLNKVDDIISIINKLKSIKEVDIEQSEN